MAADIELQEIRGVQEVYDHRPIAGEIHRKEIPSAGSGRGQVSGRAQHFQFRVAGSTPLMVEPEGTTLKVDLLATDRGAAALRINRHTRDLFVESSYSAAARQASQVAFEQNFGAR